MEGNFNSLLEEAIRFRLVKYYMAYCSVLDLVLRARAEAAIADAIEPFHVYLECGASDRVALSLMSLGLSRATALALCDKVRFPDDASPEVCLADLARRDLGALAIPVLCRREVVDLVALSEVLGVPPPRHPRSRHSTRTTSAAVGSLSGRRRCGEGGTPARIGVRAPAATLARTRIRTPARTRPRTQHHDRSEIGASHSHSTSHTPITPR